MRNLLLFNTLLSSLLFANFSPAPVFRVPEGVKFGVCAMSSFYWPKFGVFVEYEVHETIGLRTGLLRFFDAHVSFSSAGGQIASLLVPKYVSVPLIARFYPGAKRQFCMFAGLQANHLTGGRVVRADNDDTQEGLKRALTFVFFGSTGSDRLFRNDWKGELREELGAQSWGYHFLMGFDYESLLGYQLGLEYGWGSGPIPIARDRSFFNWTLKTYLGWNLAKFF